MRRLPPALSPVLRPAALACALLLTAPLVAAGASAADPRPVAAVTAAGDPGEPGEPGTPPGTVRGTDGVPQTSDGVVGRTPATGPSGRVAPRASGGSGDATLRSQWQVAPGVRARVWEEQTPRGPVRLQLLSVDWKAPGVRLDQADPGKVARVATVRDIVRRDRAVAGVNGDFFDIGDTGAPLGVARDRQRGLLHGRAEGWNSAFYVGGKGRPDIGTLPVTGGIKERPALRLTNLNSPAVTPGGIGVYTPAWGGAVGARVTDGVTTGVRAVVIRDGKVARNTTRLTGIDVPRGKVLVGRGDGARSLTSLKRGQRVTVKTAMSGVAPQMAITGNVVLADDGAVKAIDDREMHPRTAIGIDRDTHQVLMLVVDGRQSFSRGYTMVELAEKMIDLGAEDALNLDGGGSSTMLARRGGEVRTVNSPSDGFERRVANAVEVTYHQP